MHIVLVDNVLLEQDGPGFTVDLQPHLGLISLLAVIEREGHTGAIVNPKLALHTRKLSLNQAFYSSIASHVLQQAPDVVGMTTLGCNFPCTVKIASYIKRSCREIPIVLGGPHATILDREILDGFCQFDLILRGEGELTLPLLLQALSTEEYGRVPGLTYRDGRRTVRNADGPIIADLDVLPRALYGHHPIAGLGLTSVRVEAGRGCPFACTFCSTASFFGRRYRLKSAERLCSELDELNRTYGISHFDLTHDLFTASKAKVYEYCELVQHRPYTWSCSARADCVDDLLLRRMRKAGCSSIYFGIESGSPRIQRLVDKRLDLASLQPALEVAQTVGMAATTSFITGYPQEDEADQAQTLHLIDWLWHKYPSGVSVQLHLLTPEPGIPLLRSFKDQLAYDEHVSDFNVPAIESDDNDLIRSNPDVFVNHHYFKGVIPRDRHILVTSVFHTLSRLGRPLLLHILGHHDSSLVALVAEIVEWARDRRPTSRLDDNVLLGFLVGKFGQAHYLTSLLRYVLVVSDRQRLAGEWSHLATAAVASERLPGSLLRYQLSSRAAVMRELHACAEMLELLRSSDRPDTSVMPGHLCQQKNDYLLVLSADGQAVGDFRVPEHVADILEYLSEPHSLEEVCNRAGEARGSDEIPLLLDYFVSTGAVTTCIGGVDARFTACRKDTLSPDMAGRC